MAAPQRFSLKWNNYITHLTTAFDSLRDEDDFVDCTLSCDGKRIKAHKMLLSACSSYFREIFKENPCQHPVIILKGVSYNDLEALVDFMYNGEVNVVQEQLGSFLNTAELLQVRGLTDGADKGAGTTSAPPPPSPQPNLLAVPKEPPSPQSILPTPLPRSVPSHPPPAKRKRTAPPTDFSEHSMSSSSRSPAMPSPITHVNVSVPNKVEVPVIDLDDDIPPVKSERTETVEPEYFDENDDSLAFADEGGDYEGDPSVLSESDLKLTHDITTEPGPSNDSVLSDPGTSGEGTPQDPSQGIDVPARQYQSTPSKALQQDPSTPSEASRQSTPSKVHHESTPTNVSIVLPAKKTERKSSHCSEGPYICVVCDRRYSVYGNLYHHMALHRGQTKCPVCLRVFSTVQCMKNHINTVHAKDGKGPFNFDLMTAEPPTHVMQYPPTH